MKRVKSTPPGVYVAGAGVLVGGTAALLLATTKSGQELLARTVQLMLGPSADEEESQDSDEQDAARDESAEGAEGEEEPEEDASGEDEFDVQEDTHDEPAEGASGEESEEDLNVEDGSEVTDLKPRRRRTRSQAPGVRKATSA